MYTVVLTKFISAHAMRKPVLLRAIMLVYVHYVTNFLLHFVSLKLQVLVLLTMVDAAIFVSQQNLVMNAFVLLVWQ